MAPNRQISNFALFSGSYALPPDFTWTITNVEELLQRPNGSFSESESFAWSAYPQVGARLRLTVNAASKTVSMGMSLFPLGRGPRRPIKKTPAVYYVLRDVSGWPATQHVVRSSRNAHIFDYDLKFSCPFLQSWLRSPVHNANDSVRVQVYVEPPKSVQKAKSQNGTMYWTITNWWRRTQAQVDGCLEFQEGPYFYAFGCKCQVWVSVSPMPAAAAALGECAVVAAQIVFLSTIHQRERHVWNHRHRTAVTLRKLKCPDLISQTVEVDRVTGSGYNVIFPEVRLNTYVVNDWLSVKVAIELLP